MTDERQCVHMMWDDACGEEAGAEIHQDRARWNFHPFEAAPSTDEGEARWERRDDDDVGLATWEKREVAYSIPLSLEAAIRAPLEELMGALTLERDAAEGFAQSLQADNERLREALRALVDKILGPDEGSEAWDELVDLADVGMRALATPPSSTEGTKEVEG